MERNEFYTSLEKWIKEMRYVTPSEQYQILAFSEQVPVMDLRKAKAIVLEEAMNIMNKCKCQELCVR